MGRNTSTSRQSVGLVITRAGVDIFGSSRIDSAAAHDYIFRCVPDFLRVVFALRSSFEVTLWFKAYARKESRTHYCSS
jgi:hypothetical protein